MYVAIYVRVRIIYVVRTFAYVYARYIRPRMVIFISGFKTICPMTVIPEQSEMKCMEYLPPCCEVFDVKAEGVVCASGVGEDMEWLP